MEVENNKIVVCMGAEERKAQTEEMFNAINARARAPIQKQVLNHEEEYVTISKDDIFMDRALFFELGAFATLSVVFFSMF